MSDVDSFQCINSLISLYKLMLQLCGLSHCYLMLMLMTEVPHFLAETYSSELLLIGVCNCVVLARIRPH